MGATRCQISLLRRSPDLKIAILKGPNSKGRERKRRKGEKGEERKVKAMAGERWWREGFGVVPPITGSRPI